MLGLAGAELIFFPGWYGHVFGICAEHGVDNVEMFSWLNGAYTDPEPFLLFVLACN